MVPHSEGVTLIWTRWSSVLAWTVTGVAMAVLIGWQFNISFLKSPLPYMNAMNPTTALVFILSGLALLLFTSNHRVQIKIGKSLAVVIFTIGLIRLLTDSAGMNMPIDLILFKSRLMVENSGPITRMAPNTAFNFVLLALALLVLQRESSKRRWMLSQVIGVILFLASWLSVLIYFYRVESFEGILAKVPMAPYTAVCFLLFAIALLMVKPERGLMKELTGPFSGSVMARYLVPAAIIVPSILGYLRLLGGWRDLYSVEAGVAILVLTIMCCFLGLTWSIVVLLNRRDIIRLDAEKLIHEQDALVQGVFHSSPDALVIVKSDGSIKLVNSQCEIIFGYQHDELIGQPIEVLIPDRFKKNHPNERAQFFASPKARPMGSDLELFARRKDASEFPVEISLSPMKTHEELLISATIRDITKRKEAEHQMRFLATTASCIQDVVMVTDLEFRITKWNRAAEQLLGWKEAEVLGKPTSILNTKYPSTTRELAIAAIKEVGHWNGEIMVSDKAGTLLHFMATYSAMKDDRDNSVGYLVLARDITQQKKNQEQINLLARLVEDTSEAVYSVTTDFKIRTWNKGAESLYGFTASEAIGKSVYEIVRSSIPVEKRLNIREQIIKNGNWKGELEHRTKVGSTIYILASATATRNALGEVDGYVSVAQDITRKKQVENELALLNKELEQRVAERSKELVKSEAFNRGVLDSLSAHVAVVDASGKVVAVNEAWNKFSIENGESTLQRTGVGSNYFFVCEKASLNGDAVAGEALNGLRNVMDGTIQHFEMEYPCHSPTEKKWFNMRALRFKNDLPMVVLTHQDISERREAEIKIMESEDRFRSLYENSGEGILLTDARGNILSANPTACKLFGRSEAEICKVGRDGLVDLNDPRIALGLEERARTGKMHGEWTFIRKDGTKFQGDNTSTVFINARGEVRASVFIRDVTERKRAEEELKASEARLADAQEVAKVGSWETDLSSQKVYWSKETYRIFELSPSDFQASHPEFLNYVHPEDRSLVDNAFTESFNTASVCSVRHRILTPGGQIKFLEERWRIVRNEIGQPIRAAGTCQDITERKKIEDEIKQFNKALEETISLRTQELQNVNKELEAFSYSVSHDLRAPLRSIDGYAHILQEDYNDKLDDEGRRVISVITRNATRMGQLIDDMLAFSKYGRMEMSVATISMKEVVETILNELVANENDRVIHIHVGNLHNSQGDVDMLRQVWINYITNALKFTSKVREAQISITSYLSNDEVCYSIRDNGAGFNNQYAPKLFGVFQRLHKQSEFEGTGVGLATCKRIVERHGGRVWAEGEPGQGATFYFSIPVKIKNYE